MDSTICRYKHLIRTTHSIFSPTPAPLLTAVEIGILARRDTKQRYAVEGVQRLEEGRGQHRQFGFRLNSHILNRHHLHDIVEQTTLCLRTHTPRARSIFYGWRSHNETDRSLVSFFDKSDRRHQPQQQKQWIQFTHLVRVHIWRLRGGCPSR